MIVGPDYVFISTPKCATHTMYDVLRKDFGGKRLKPYHRREVLEADQNKFRFTIVRNPYSRAVCMWWIMTNSKFYSEPYHKTVRRKNLLDYLKWVMIPSNQVRRMKILTWTQSQWHPEKIKFIKLETLQQDFDNLPFVDKKVKLPRHLKRTPEGLNVLTDEAKVLIREWCAEDFRRFDY